MKTFKQFLSEDDDHTLLSKLIAGLLAKGQQVRIFAEVWTKDPKKRKGAYYDITSVHGKILNFTNGNISTWVELNDDESDSTMPFKKEDGVWTLREKGGGPILS